MEKRAERIVLLGHTGAGKSETANTLAGQQNLFEASSSVESCTDRTSFVTTKWFGLADESELTLIDSPGLGDSKGADSAHIAEMVS